MSGVRKPEMRKYTCDSIPVKDEVEPPNILLSRFASPHKSWKPFVSGPQVEMATQARTLSLELFTNGGKRSNANLSTSGMFCNQGVKL